MQPGDDRAHGPVLDRDARKNLVRRCGAVVTAFVDEQEPGHRERLPHGVVTDRHAPRHFCNRSMSSFRAATPCTAPRCRQAARLWVSRSASAARSQAAMDRSIADRHPASLVEVVSLPGPDGIRHTPASTDTRARGPCHYPGAWRVGSTCPPSPQLHIAQPSARVTVDRSTSLTLRALASMRPHAALPTCPASNCSTSAAPASCSWTGAGASWRRTTSPATCCAAATASQISGAR